MGTIREIRFENRFTNFLPADSEAENRERQVYAACYSRVTPAKVKDPKLVAHSKEMMALLGLDPLIDGDGDIAAVLSGAKNLPGMDPHAMCYGGHQFGHWAGQLGDGRAIALGEIVDVNGQHQMLQLKGAGPTPYSRSADGLAVMRSSVREFLCSEAMHHLGVPTTRALSLVGTGDAVMRDMFYNGNVKPEPGAIVCRVAPSFIRFGNFEIFSSRDDIENLRKLTDFVIETQFEEIDVLDPDKYVLFLNEVVSRTAEMVVEWMRVGFVHGVMNTDNMSNLGLTIDYGPYGWLDNYDPDWTPNTTDAAQKRYRYGYQSQVAHWNLAQLANALYPLIGEVEPLQAAIDKYKTLYEKKWAVMMAAKLGLPNLWEAPNKQIADLALKVLELTETDMTIFWRQLAEVPSNAEIGADDRINPLKKSHYKPEDLDLEKEAQIQAFADAYATRLRLLNIHDAERRESMNAVNPKFVLRNYLSQIAIEQAEVGNNELVNELLDVMRHPYDDQANNQKYAELRPDWARTKPGCSQLSCSS